MKNYILKINCKDRAGIIFAVSNFLFKYNFNILESSQFRDVRNNNFFMRVKFESINHKNNNDIKNIENKFISVANKFKMNFTFFDTSKKQNILIMVSKFGHCLNSILY